MASATLGCAAASWCIISQVSNCCYNYPPSSFNVCIAAPAFRDSLRGRMDGYTLGARQAHSEAVADVDAQRNATTFAAAASQPYVQVVVESNPTATAPDAANQLLFWCSAAATPTGRDWLRGWEGETNSSTNQPTDSCGKWTAGVSVRSTLQPRRDG
jgi:hypothetical protein